MRKLGVVSLFFLFFGIGTGSAWVFDEIHAVKLRPDQLPEGWRLTNEFPIPDEKVQTFRGKFLVPIDGMLYQSFLVGGAGEVRINYASCPDERQTASLYQKLIELVGGQNVVVRKARVVVEVISKLPSLKEAVLERLPITLLQKRKLRVPHIPAGWKLVSEIFVPQNDLEGFEKRFQVKLEEILNQFLFVNGERLRLNYLAVSREDEVRKTHERMAALVGGSNVVLSRGRIVVEAITEKPFVKREVEALLDRLLR